MRLEGRYRTLSVSPNSVILGDCLDVMKDIPNKSVDMILCDLPYGVTDCRWDIIIPFDLLWAQYRRIRKDGTPVILFGREPFTSLMICSNIKEYKHKWIWNKKQSGSWANAKFMPLQIEEDIICFSNGKVNYYPIMRKGKLRKKGGFKERPKNLSGIQPYFTYSDEYYPTNILEFPNCVNRKNNLHPTQKPVELIEYLIKTYTNEGDIVLDNCAGSGTTGVACINTNRKYILIEKEKEYYDIILERLSNCRERVLF